MMKIERKSMMSGKVNTMEIDVTQEQLDMFNNMEGLIQNIMPNLTADEREFIMTGTTASEWDEIFKSEEEE